MRQAEISRNTLETRITVRLNLDGTGQCRLATGVPFLDHMLDQVARHGLIDLEVEADGDLHIDAHHTVEDIGITIGQALAKASATRRASAATGTPTCRSTKRFRAW
jgi:imidazoleglycerol-phosphate dehydratase